MANEKRLIDANALIAEYDRVHIGEPGKARKLIEDAPTVEAVEIVRCEKCKHAVWDEEYKMWKCVESAEYDEELGEWIGFFEYHYGDYFCSYGERKEGADND